MKHRWRLLVMAVATAAVWMIYEGTKTVLAPGLSSVQSHAITVAFMTVVAVVMGHLVFGRETRARSLVVSARTARAQSESTLRAFANACRSPPS